MRRGIDLVMLMRLTLARPREGMRAMLALDLPMSAGLAGLALMAVISTLILHLFSLDAFAGMTGNPVVQLMTEPFAAAAVQFGFLLLMAWLIHRIGAARGGHGDMSGAVVAVAWLEAAMLVVQLAQIVIALMLPGLVPLLMIVSIAFFFWLLSNFVAEVHGFRSLGWVFAGVVVTLLLVSIALSFLLTLILGPEALSNV